MIALSGKKVAVVGMGLSGVAAAELARKHGATVALTDDKNEQDLRETMDALKDIATEYRLGGIDGGLLMDSDLVILSPGVPSDLSQIERARRAGVEIISEIELAYAFCEAPAVAITGTNGKTTTTKLIHHIIVHGGLAAVLGGNIEIPFSSVLDKKPLDVYVLEVSSFQLENIREFRPKVGVLLNVSPDHLDRYRSMDEYIAAKALMFKNQTADDFAVLNRDAPAASAMADGLASCILWFSAREDVDRGAFVRGDKLFARFEDAEREIMKIEDIPLLGRHNVENVLAAVAATLPLRIPFETYAPAVMSFAGVTHRLEKVREVNGVLYVNDSKATNIGALETALASFDRPIILIAGGRGKGSSYRVLRSLFKQKVKAMITLGEDAPLLEEALGDVVSSQRAASLPEAVERAAELAEPGDCVLLAPACASFDMFRNYAHRGTVFKEAVERL